MDFMGAGQQIRDDYHQKLNKMELPGSEEDQKEMRKALLEKFEEHFKEYEKQQLDLHDRHLSEAVVDASIAFYVSPEGEELLKVSKMINEECEELSFRLTQAVHEDMAEIIEPYIDEDYEFPG
jgi:hypothetical protein